MDAENYFSEELQSFSYGTQRKKPGPNQSLFKYVSLNSKTSWNFFESTINELKLFGGTYNALNDPFEMSPVFLDDITPRIKHADKRPRITLSHQPPPPYTDADKSEDIEAGLKTAWRYIEGVRTRSRIIAFSDRFDAPLLWSHYSNQYYGACLQFTGSAISWRETMDGRCKISYVDYANQRPIYPLSLAQKLGTKTTSGHPKVTRLESEKMLFFTKARDWSYECEIRAVYSATKATHLTFEPSEILSIILGPRMSVEDRNRIIDLVKKSKFPNLPIREAKISTSSFSVSVDWEINLNI